MSDFVATKVHERIYLEKALELLDLDLQVEDMTLGVRDRRGEWPDFHRW